MSPGREVYKLDRKAEILSKKVVLLLFTQYNLVGFDSGFSANAYELLCPYSATDLARIQAIELKLKKSSVVQNQLWEEASTTNRDYNQLLHEMAVAQYELNRP
jgi:hypothetical protein